jgi:MFS family permease
MAQCPAVSDQPSQRWWQRLWDSRLDLSPLWIRDFRLLFTAATVGYLGSMVGYVAVPFQIFQLTRSNLAVGIVGGIELVPLIVFGLWGGALADRFDRRAIMVVAGVFNTILAAALLANALSHRPQVWVIYLVAGLLSVSSSLQRPSQDALMPRTVPHSKLTAAVAAWSLAWQLGSLVGPAVGGVLIAHFSVAVGYVIWVAGALLTVILLARLGPYPPAERTAGSAFRSIGVGLRYAAGRRDLLGTYIVDLVGMFMAMPTVLFPAFGIDVFGHPELVGLLYASEGLGSALATLTSGWMARVHRHGRAITLAAICWGATIAVVLARLRPVDPGRRLRPDQRHLPDRVVEPDHPRRVARPAGRHRDALLLRRTVGWPVAGRGGRGPDRCPYRDRLRRCPLRARRDHHHCRDPRLLELRQPHRPACRTGAGTPGRRILTSAGKSVLGVPSTPFPEIDDR